MSKIEFINIPIKQIGKVVTGKTPLTVMPEYYDGEYMFITPTELHGEYMISYSEKTLSKQGMDSIKNNTISGISVLVGCIGWDMGNIAMCFENCATNQQINSITGFKSAFNPYYVYYWLSTKKDYLFSISSVTRTPILSKSTFEEIEIPLPEKKTQDEVVKTLLSIDQKIQLNNRIIAEMESMAKTIYDYWFVQFDFPNAEGNPYRASGGEMVWNEQLKREIPKGWVISPLPKVCSIIDCLHSAKPDMVYEAEDYYLLQLENLVDHGLVSLKNKYYVTKEMYELWSSRIEVAEGDLVITNAGRVGSVARVPHNVKAGIGRNMTAIRPESIPPCFLYYFITGSDVSAQIKVKTDTGSFFGSLNVRGIKELLMTLPSKNNRSILKDFESLVYPIRRKIEVCAQENQELTNLRDWLLPMLMNGQVTVK